jgi:hypothetical protein
MTINKLKNKFLFLLLLLIVCFNYSNFIGFKEVKDDNVDYLKYSLNFAIHNKQSMSSHQDNEILFDDERSPGYSFLNSLLLRSDKKDLLKKNLDCFLNGKEKFCKNVIEKLQKINFLFYLMTIFSIIFITFEFTKNLFYSILISIFFSINTFFISNISYVNPEIMSVFIILWLSYFSYKFYQKENYFNQTLLLFFASLIYFFKPVYIFYLLFMLIMNIFLDIKSFRSLKKKNLNILIIFILSISPILFIKIITVDKIIKVTNTSSVIVQIKENYYKKYSANKYKNDMRNYNNHDNFLPDNTGGEVFLARAVYGFIRWDEIVPLTISFLPRVNNYLLDNFYEFDQIERIKPGASFEGRNRNFFLIYRKYISEDFLLDKGYDLKKINTFQKSTIVYFSNTFKQIVLTPIFILRGILSTTNYNDVSSRFENKIISSTYKFFALLTFIVQFISLFFIIFSFLKYILNNDNNRYLYFIMLPSYSIIFHGVLTHFIPRYSQPLISTAYIFLGILLYELIYKKFKL